LGKAAPENGWREAVQGSILVLLRLLASTPKLATVPLHEMHSFPSSCRTPLFGQLLHRAAVLFAFRSRRPGSLCSSLFSGPSAHATRPSSTRLDILHPYINYISIIFISIDPSSLLQVSHSRITATFSGLQVASASPTPVYKTIRLGCLRIRPLFHCALNYLCGQPLHSKC
jgi:hypothetical protein